MNLVLIGYRGTGKTTVARHLGDRLHWSWIDADVELERRAGKAIAAIFAEDGEKAFRDLESLVVADLARQDRLVLAAGGGAILRPENRDALKRSGKLVWLRAEPATIFARVTGDATTAGRRPNLTAGGGQAEIVAVLAQRTPIYRQCADLEVDTEDKTPGEVAEEILQRLDLSPTASESA